MTWAEFKAAIEEQGVKDDSEVGHISWSSCDDWPGVAWYTSGEFGVDDAEVSYVDEDETDGE